MQSTLKPLDHQVLFEVNGYTAEICIEPESLQLAYHLRYQAYRHADAIPANEEAICTDSFDEQRNARTFLIWFEDQTVASVRSLTWSASYDWAPTPSINFFKTEVDHYIGLSSPILESNRYVTAPDFTGRKSLTAQMLLFRIQTLGALVDQCAYVITAVRPRHVKFYERFMNFFSISDPLKVDEVSFEIQLLATPIASKDKLSKSSAIATYEEADLERYQNCMHLLYQS
ncbi:MAG: hypothetical protein HRU41_09895 [Saprospiraceae bacterium]|nr:hypothetical protein [Saprospiraceae bacterium]